MNNVKDPKALKDTLNDPKALFESLINRVLKIDGLNPQKLRAAGREQDAATLERRQQLVTAHLQSVSGVASLPVFLNCHLPDADKVQHLQLCIRACIKGEEHLLQGSIAQGQADQDKPAPEPVRPEPQPAAESAPANPEPSKTDKIARILKELLDEGKPAPVAGAVDTEQVATIARDAVREAFKQYRTDLVAECLSQLPPRETVVIRRAGLPDTQVDGMVHFQMTTLLKLVSADMPVWAYGAPGCGKSVMAEQIGKGLGLRVHAFNCGPTTTEAKILGFMRVGDGRYVEGIAYQPYKEGGLLFLDEIDVADPGVLVGVQTLASSGRFTFPSGDTVEKHPDFRILACANTTGKGSTGGMKRRVIDAATLDRFAMVAMQYDDLLEGMLAGDGYLAWASYVQQVRAYLDKHASETAYASTRAVVNGIKCLAAGFTPSEAATFVFANKFGPTLWKAVQENVKLPEPTAFPTVK